MMHKLPIGVLGASGYAGRELCALVQRHPHMSLAFATANEQRGKTVELPGGGSVKFVATDDAPLAEAALVFSSLPHGASKGWVERARAAGARVVDLSTDLRIGNGETGIPYGLTEARRAEVRGAELVANPGCYPTSILLALLPLIEAGLVAEGATIVADSASGVTGAGFSARTDLLFGEVTENYRAYGIGNTHRHLNEMRAALGEWKADADLLFTPHLLPIARGILSTLTVPLARPLDDVMSPWRARYAGERFIELVDGPPELRHVNHRNVVRIHATAVQGVRRPTLLVLSAIDNLMKGAAGQAVQNANLMLGLDEAAGLPV
ncbi:MAG: N-acetyl-gamma-glutamyl-phosphate reductase [Gemmatimonadetes bacterium]|nr:N-acetyl-gamma-glutamyl-phosphate reductase [Gemmatimonadota bacterium]MBI3504612.1 N-acetyl-gamma-glutamyl-phosphate reductase [Pseudomonadota bacterium]